MEVETRNGGLEIEDKRWGVEARDGGQERDNDDKN